MTLLRLAALFACAALLGGCGQAHEVIDGWPIASCGPEGPYLPNGLNAARSMQDELLIQTAERRLYHRDPYHAEVVSKVLCTEVIGDGLLPRSTGITVAVFVLAGGGKRAIYVAQKFEGEVVTVDYGP